MQPDFSSKGKVARDLIAVPELHMESIRRRSHVVTARSRIRALALCGAIFLIVLGTSVGFGAKIYDGVRIWLTGGKAAVVVNSLVLVREPTASDVRKVVARATFPVILPTGVPAGTQVSMLMFAPAEHPNSITIAYRNEVANFNVGVSLFDSSVVNTAAAMLPTGSARPPFRQGYQWQIGRETVLVRKEDVSVALADKIKMAMMKASENDSLAVTDGMLHTVTVVGRAPRLADTAERYAPPHSSSVLLDREQIRQLSDRSLRNKPVLDTRTVYLSNIPSVHGEPDYSKAMLRWPKTIVISVGGVRAIEAVLRSTSARGDCSCEILFDQPNPATYWVWRLPLSAAVSVKKYAVNAKTFAVKITPLLKRP